MDATSTDQREHGHRHPRQRRRHRRLQRRPTRPRRRRRARATRWPARPPSGRRHHVGHLLVERPVDRRPPRRPRATDGGVSMLGGFITIGSVTSTATATSDGTTGKVTGSTAIQNVSIAGEPVTVDANGIQAAGKSPPARCPISRINTLLNELGISMPLTNADRHGQRPLGQPDARRPQDHHRPQDPGRRRQPVRLAAARLAHLAAARRHPERAADHPGPGTRPGELDRLARLRRRQQRATRAPAPSAVVAPRRGAVVHRQLGQRLHRQHGQAAALSPAAPAAPRTRRPRPPAAARARRRPVRPRPRPSGAAFKGIGAALILLGLLAAAALAYGYKRADDATRAARHRLCRRRPAHRALRRHADDLSDFGGFA